MTTFEDVMRTGMPEGFTMPEAFSRLFAWMEAHGTVERHDHATVGYLAPLAELERTEDILDEDGEWERDRRFGGTTVAFTPYANEAQPFWFGIRDEAEIAAVRARLFAFASTGGEGSSAAFWRDDEGRQRIVHMGSGSGSTLVCVLCDTAEDFLRLCAIGYDELCWNENYALTAEESFERADIETVPYEPFQRFVTEELGLTVPARASEIVTRTVQMDDEPPTGDPFADWVATVRR